MIVTAVAFRVSSTRSWPSAMGGAVPASCCMVMHRGTRTEEPGARQLNYRVTVSALEQLFPIQREKPFYFWYSDRAPRADHSAYLSIASCYLWGYRLFSASFPARTTPSAPLISLNRGSASFC